MYIATLRSVLVVIVCIALAHLSPQSKHAGEPNSEVKGVLTSTSTTVAERQVTVPEYPLAEGYFGDLHLHTAYLLVPEIFDDAMNNPLTVHRLAKRKVGTLADDMCDEDSKAFAETIAGLWARIKQAAAQNYEQGELTSLATPGSPDPRICAAVVGETDSAVCRWGPSKTTAAAVIPRIDFGRSVQQRAVQSMLILDGQTAAAQAPSSSPCTVSATDRR